MSTPRWLIAILVPRRPAQKAFLCVCDSKIVQFLSVFCKKRIKNVVRGSDLTVRLLETFSENEAILVIGSDESHAERIKQRFGLKNVKCYVPPMGFVHIKEEVNKVKHFLKNESARIVFLAVGSPQQELVATEYNEENGDKMLICCGNAINFAVGLNKRAPAFMSRIGLEWFYRIIQEPGRMAPRYLANLKIFPLFFIK